MRLTQTKSIFLFVVMSFVICACSDETVEKLKTAKGAFDQFTGLKAAIDEQLPDGASGFTIHNG